MTQTPPASARPGGPDRPPPPLTVAISLVALEGVALVMLGVAEMASVRGPRMTMGVTTALFFAVYGVGLAYCAWQVWRLESWARAPIVLAQLIQLGVAWSFRGGAGTLATVGLGVVAAVVLAGVFHPDSIRALADED